MPKTANRFDRKEPSRKPLPIVLVLCEDSQSSKKYLQDAARYFRANLKIEVDHQDTCPRNSVRAAIKQRAKYDGQPGKYNEIYCCIDRDEHVHFDEALQLAAQAEIQIVASYPCFEFWLLLHFQRTRKSYARNARGSAANAVKVDLLAQPGMSDYDKGATKGLFIKLEPQRHIATVNAQWTRIESSNDSNNNPSTTIDLLLERFEALGI